MQRTAGKGRSAKDGWLAKGPAGAIRRRIVVS